MTMCDHREVEREREPLHSERPGTGLSSVGGRVAAEGGHSPSSALKASSHATPIPKIKLYLNAKRTRDREADQGESMGF